MKKYTDEELALILDMKKSGAKVREIADRLGRSEAAVNQRITQFREEGLLEPSGRKDAVKAKVAGEPSDKQKPKDAETVHHTEVGTVGDDIDNHTEVGTVGDIPDELFEPDTDNVYHTEQGTVTDTDKVSEGESYMFEAGTENQSECISASADGEFVMPELEFISHGTHMDGYSTDIINDPIISALIAAKKAGMKLKSVKVETWSAELVFSVEVKP